MDNLSVSMQSHIDSLHELTLIISGYVDVMVAFMPIFVFILVTAILGVVFYATIQDFRRDKRR